MKKNLLIITLSLITLFINAQQVKITSAQTYIDLYLQKEGDQNLEKAKSEIDEAVLHEKTVAMAKAWFVKGQVYQLITESKELAPKYATVNILDEAYDAYKKAITLNDIRFRDQEATFTYQKTYNGNNASGQATSCTATRTAWYQNPASYSARAQLVAKYRIGGLAEWTIGMEEQSATDEIRRIALTIAPDAVLLSLATDQMTVKYGSYITITGQATRKDKSLLPGLPVSLEFKGFDESTWRQIGKPITAESGSFTSSLYLAKSGKLRITSEGSWDRGAGLSSDVSITVNPRLNITAPTSAKSGAAMKVLVVAAPVTAGALATLQRFDGKAWVNLTSLPLLATGTEFSPTELIRGVFSYRVVVLSSADASQATSSPFIVVVR
jgi:hypothetical protein